MAEHTPTLEQARRRTRPETSAWLTLVTFFAIFCALIATLCVIGWRYYTTATIPVSGALVRVHAPAGVTYQARGSVNRDTPVALCNTPPNPADRCREISEGDHVRAVPQAGYGPVASIVLPDQTRVADMYAYPTGADLTLDRYQVSRWTTRLQDLQFSQTAGYVRYDLPDKLGQPYEAITYGVAITEGVSLLLAPGGSYSVDVPHYDGSHPPALAPSGKPIMAEITVRAGSVEASTPGGTAIVRPGQKLQIDAAGVAGEPQPATWQLIRDGDFSQYMAGNRDTWELYSHIFDATVSEREKNGRFLFYNGCKPETPSFCTADQAANIVQFHREGNQPKSFGIGIQQDLDLDVSEYRSLHFSMWARVIQQSVQGAGIANSECPITIAFDFKQSSPTDNEEHRLICAYRDETGQLAQLNGNLSGEFIYRAVPPSLWYHLSYDLRDGHLLPSARYLQRIRIYANGHDYISEVTDISLVAAQSP